MSFDGIFWWLVMFLYVRKHLRFEYPPKKSAWKPKAYTYIFNIKPCVVEIADVWLMGRLVSFGVYFKLNESSICSFWLVLFVPHMNHATPSTCHHGYHHFNSIICTSQWNVCNRLQRQPLSSLLSYIIPPSQSPTAPAIAFNFAIGFHSVKKIETMNWNWRKSLKIFCQNSINLNIKLSNINR